jgi:hypothetical protein
MLEKFNWKEKPINDSVAEISNLDRIRRIFRKNLPLKYDINGRFGTKID